MIIAIGTKNPAKIKAVELGFKRMFPDETISVNSYDVASGVSSQPMSDAECVTGAKNRAQNALNQDPDADYGVGLEGGIDQVGDEWYDCGWCAIVSKTGEIGVASSARIPTPEKIMQHIRKGEELGNIIDVLFNRNNVKQAEGHFGLMTNNAVTRTDGYVHAVCLAFSRFLHPEIF
jgi:inosine/xanthosine triphosphatase